MYTGKERRQHARYNAGNMTANMSFEENGKIVVEKVKAVDFNSIGMSIETNLVIEIGTRITVDIGKGKNRLTDLICTVMYVEEQEYNLRYGLQFDFGANEYMCSEEVEMKLIDIEKAAKKSHSSPHRAAYRRIKTRGR